MGSDWSKENPTGNSSPATDSVDETKTTIDVTKDLGDTNDLDDTDSYVQFDLQSEPCGEGILKTPILQSIKEDSYTPVKLKKTVTIDIPDYESEEDERLAESYKNMRLRRASHTGLTKPVHVEIRSTTTPELPASDITILHFNDVYNIEPRDQEPVGGAARFVTKVRSFGEKEPLILFSGDCLNPSLSE